MIPYHNQRATTADKRLKRLINKLLIWANYMHNPSTQQTSKDKLFGQIYKKLSPQRTIRELTLATLVAFLELIKYTFSSTTPSFIQDFNLKDGLTSQIEYILDRWNTISQTLTAQEAISTSPPRIWPYIFEMLPIFPKTDISKTTLYTTPWAESARNIPAQTNYFKKQLACTCPFAPLIYSFRTISFYITLHSAWALEYIPLPESLPLFMLDAPLAYFNLINKFYQHIFVPSQRVPKLFYFLPTFYRKPIKRFYTQKTTLLALSRFKNSKKKSKKYLRILHKRLGLYRHKKVPWKE